MTKKTLIGLQKKISSDYNLYTRSMYNYFSKQNNLEHFFILLKVKNQKIKFKNKYQEFTYTSLRVNIKKLSFYKRNPIVIYET